ncbi:MAG TPA: hypothetical protein PLJ38_06945, partial [bacterium]|nr:hypothetical protein [bacterium]
DIERLLQIPIKKISRYDIEKAKQEKDDIVRDIKKCKSNLRQITQFTIDFIQKLLDKYGKHYKRRTKIGLVEVVSKSEAALENVKVCYDKMSGYIGTDVKTDDFIVTSDYAKILVINKKGIYKVINVSDKEFVDKDVIYFDVYNENVVFTAVYKNKKNGAYYAKRFKVEKFITAKEYRYLPEDGKYEFFTADNNVKIYVEYEKKPKLKKINEQFDLTKDIPIKGAQTLGLKITDKEIAKIKLVK